MPDSDNNICPCPPPICVLGLNAHTLPLVQQAHCIAAPQSLLHHAHGSTQECLTLDRNILHTIEILSQRRLEGKHVVVLVHGDPLYFGIGTTLVRRLGAHAVRIIPDISIVQRVCAHMGMGWHDMRHVSLHGRRCEAQQDTHYLPLFHAVLANKAVCVLTDAHASPSQVAQKLLERGAAEREIHIFTQWGTPYEAHDCLSLTQCAVHEKPCPQPCTLLIMPSKVHTAPRMGVHASELVCENQLMTKLPIRATALSLLCLAPHHTLWDVGSGSGALALEAASLLYEGHCIAIEHKETRVAHIHENRRRMGALNVHICHGTVPDCLASLPNPDSIFVGGGLSRCVRHTEEEVSDTLLDTLCTRLSPAGRMVISCVLLGTLHKVQSFFEKKGWQIDITHIQVAQSAVLGADTRLVPHNPVFLVHVQK